MSPDKKQWTRPEVYAADLSIFTRWEREKLLQLVQRVVNLVERAGDAPVATAKLREALDRIGEELAK